MKTLATLTLAVTLLFPVASLASDASDDMDFCICRNVVARLLCKDVDEINLVGKVRDGLYIYSVFYANKVSKFYCGVGEKYVKLQGFDRVTVTRSIPYTYDPEENCGIIDYYSDSCPVYTPVKCCANKDADQRKADEFWDKPLPQLLDEDLRDALQAGNATEGQ